MKAKLSKQKKSLLRVIIASVVFAALFITEHTVQPEWYVSLPLFLALYLFIGWDIAYKAFKGVIGGQMMDENLLMFIATVGAFIVGEYPEAAAVMLFYQIGELFQSYAVGKSRSSIAALLSRRRSTRTSRSRTAFRVTGRRSVVFAGQSLMLSTSTSPWE